MNRILLAFALALPTLAVAAPCATMPYASQCQGSNLWPVPAGWSADSNGDCQPEPPQYKNSTATVFPENSEWLGTFYGQTAEEATALFCAALLAYYPTTLAECRLATTGSVIGFAGWVGNRDCTTTPKDMVAYSFWSGAEEPCWGGAYTTRQMSGNYFRSMNLCLDPKYPNSAAGPLAGCTSTLCCQKLYSASVLKPSDGVCTARWTSSAQTTLQKDPLDPDCDAQSCVFDGTCKLL